MCHDHLRPAVFQPEAQGFFSEEREQWHGNGAKLVSGGVSYRQLGRMREQYGYPIATLDTEVPQGVREAVRGALELEEGPLLRVTVSAIVNKGKFALVHGI